jgi:hypothetical protein
LKNKEIFADIGIELNRNPPEMKLIHKTPNEIVLQTILPENLCHDTFEQTPGNDQKEKRMWRKEAMLQFSCPTCIDWGGSPWKTTYSRIHERMGVQKGKNTTWFTPTEDSSQFDIKSWVVSFQLLLRLFWFTGIG